MSQQDNQNRRATVSLESTDKSHETKKRRMDLVTEGVNVDWDADHGGLGVLGLGGQGRSSACMIDFSKSSQDTKFSADAEANYNADEDSISSSFSSKEHIDITKYTGASFCEGDHVQILEGREHNGKYNGKTAKIKTAHPECVFAQIDGSSDIRCFSNDGVRSTVIDTSYVDMNMISAENSESSNKAAIQEDDNDADMAISTKAGMEVVLRDDGNNTGFVEDDDIGASINEEETVVLGREVIKTAACNILTCSSRNSDCIDNRHKDDIAKKELQVLQPEQELNPHYGVGTSVLIIEGRFDEYCGFVVPFDGETEGQAHHQDKVSIELYNNHPTSPSPITITIETHRLKKIRNLPRIIPNDQCQQRRLVTPPTNDNYSSHHQQNSMDEEDHACVQDDDSMNSLEGATSTAAAITTLTPDNIDFGDAMIENGDDDIFAKKSNMTLSLPTPSPPNRQQDDDNNDIVYYKGNQVFVQERDSDRLKIFLVDDGTEEWIHKNELDGNINKADIASRQDDDADDMSLKYTTTDDDDDDDENEHVDNIHTTNDEWVIPGSADGGMRFSGQLVRSFRLGAYKEENFIDSFLRSRKLVVIKEFNEEQMKLPVVAIEKMGDGSVYELISTKVMDDGGGSIFFTTPKVLHMAYVQTAGPGLETVSIQDLLSRIADFGSLSPRKMVARLELFQSPAWTMDTTLQPSDFQEIPEEGQVGCGFICDRLLHNLLLRHIKTKKSVSNTVADITISIQVRIFIPSLGVYKGILMKKQIPSGSPPIQLPSSMRKIGPSRAKNPLKGAFLVINKAGLDPSIPNRMIGRLPHIDPKSPVACAKSFTPVVMSDMLLRMFIGLGVSKEITNTYHRRSRHQHGLEHAFVRGVIDPTGKLPPGTVYLSGTKRCAEVCNKLYVTRSPCLKFDDARMIRVITSKPSTLSLGEWNWLERLPFGVLIFSLPKKGMKSIPEHIANGDLDGDRYFVCWNTEILENIMADPIIDMPSTDVDVINSTLATATAGRKTEQQIQNNPNWLKQAQDHMCATFIDTKKMGQLIGCLYNMAHKTADKHNSLRHRDVTHYAIAFAQALDNGKHGGKIELPAHLYHQLRENLHELLTKI